MSTFQIVIILCVAFTCLIYTFLTGRTIWICLRHVLVLFDYLFTSWHPANRILLKLCSTIMKVLGVSAYCAMSLLVGDTCIKLTYPICQSAGNIWDIHLYLHDLCHLEGYEIKILPIIYSLNLKITLFSYKLLFIKEKFHIVLP